MIDNLIGTTFWDTPVLTFLGLENVPQIVKYVPNKGLNEVFMAVGAVGLAFNIITRYDSNRAVVELPDSPMNSYVNVFKARLSTYQSPFRPLLHLLPFPASAAIQVFWLMSPSFLTVSQPN